MKRAIVQRFGKLILLGAFLLSAAISGCSYRDASPVGEVSTLFENTMDEPVHLYVDTVLVNEIGGKRSFYFTTDRGEHTWSAKSKYYGHPVAGGTFSAGQRLQIP